MNSDIKPDFEKLAEAHCGDMYEAYAIEYVCKYNGYVNACNKIWTEHVEPLLSIVKILQEENEQLKEENRVYNKALFDINKLTEMCQQRSQITFYELPSMVSSKAHIAINDVKALKIRVK